jgi:catechol 2,3-dioxygenase-like lactoylglutathione lyase family enzyme
MISGIRHLGIVVHDLNYSLDFWVNIIGFKVSRRMEEEGAHLDTMLGLKNVKVTTVKLSANDGNLIELLHFHSHPDETKWRGKPYSTGITHVALTVEDIDKVLSKIERFGLTCSNYPQLSPDGLVRGVYANGPEGLLIELVEEKMK